MTVLQALLRGVRTGFRGLRVLEFSIDITNSTSSFSAAPSSSDGDVSAGKRQEAYSEVTFAEALIETAKDRAYAGRQGLNVTVNYR